MHAQEVHVDRGHGATVAALGVSSRGARAGPLRRVPGGDPGPLRSNPNGSGSSGVKATVDNPANRRAISKLGSSKRQREGLVNCYDCAMEGRGEVALGTCVNCGTGACQQHAQVGQRTVEHASLGPPDVEQTRLLLCTSCAQVMAT